jgi:hypothetical protein
MMQIAPADPTSLFQETTSPAALSDRYVGYRVLWLKVIIRSVFDWVTYRDNLRMEKRKYAESAYTWLFESNNLINGFESVCCMLDLSPSRVRTWAKSMSKDQVMKMEHLERDHSVSSKHLLKVAVQQLSSDTDHEAD